MKNPGTRSEKLISYFQSISSLSRWLLALILVLCSVMYAIHRTMSNGQSIVPVRVPGYLAKSLARHVDHLAGIIGERHHEQSGSLEQAAAYIEQEFQRCQLTPERESFGNPTAHNLIADIRGGTDPMEIIVVGAHYDTVWLSPGADDNASGVAAMLEISCLMSGNTYDRTLRFIAFANEEQPYAGTDAMGSRVHVKNLRARRDNVIGMYSLEMLGFYSDAPNSQSYPAPLSWFYPATANFIALASNISSAYLLHTSISMFRKISRFPVQGLVAPERWFPDIRRSDHASFWDADIPAVMVTDTSFYRNPNYHTVGDQPRTLDYHRMAAVVMGLTGMLDEQASR